jgi:hypothetical protein
MFSRKIAINDNTSGIEPPTNHEYQVSNSCKCYLPFWIFIPLTGKIDARLRAGRAENSKTARL